MLLKVMNMKLTDWDLRVRRFREWHGNIFFKESLISFSQVEIEISFFYKLILFLHDEEFYIEKYMKRSWLQ